MDINILGKEELGYVQEYYLQNSFRYAFIIAFVP